MKKLFFAAFLFFSITIQAQVGIGTASPNASAQLDITSIDKGLLIPRMTAAQIAAISFPAKGLLVFQTDNTSGFYYYDGSAWTALLSGVLPIANGGTGSSIKNFVDLSTDQIIAGKKSFNSDINVNGLIIGKGVGQNGENTAIGVNALGNGTGSRNIAVGLNAMTSYSGTSFDNNSALGYANMVSLTNGQQNTSVGAEAMLSLSTGSYNTSLGAHSLISNTGNNNIGVGYNSGGSITNGSQNTFIGTEANASSPSLNNATAIGYGAVVNADNTIQLGNTDIVSIITSANINATSFIKQGGTSSQFLKADGSVDVNTYLTTNSGISSVGVISNTSDANGASLTSGVLNLSPADAINGGVVTTGSQIFSGSKIFNDDLTIGTGPLSGTSSTKLNIKGSREFEGIKFDFPGDPYNNIFSLNWYNTAWKLRTERSSADITDLSFARFDGTNDIEYMKLSRLGNLGIGTSNPNYKLDVNGTGNFSDVLSGTSAIFNNSLIVGNKLSVGTGPLASTSSTQLNVKGGREYEGIKFDFPGDPYNNILSLNWYGTAWKLRTQRNNADITDLSFARFDGTNDIEYMKLSQLGNLGIGTSNPNYKLDVNGTGGFNGAVTANSFIKQGGSSSEFLKADGSVDANTYVSSTDVFSTFLPLAGGTLTGNLNGTGANFTQDVLMGQNVSKTTPALTLKGYSATATIGGGGLEIGNGATENMRMYRTQNNNYNISTTGSTNPYLGINADNYDPMYTLDINGTLGVRNDALIVGSLEVDGPVVIVQDLHVNGLTIGMGIGGIVTNTALGNNTLGGGVGGGNTAVGFSAMASYDGISSLDLNTAVGYNSQFSVIHGQENTSVGAEAMTQVINGRQNTSVGALTLMVAAGNKNTALGNRAGLSLITGSDNTLVGSNADVSSASLNNSAAIGADAIVSADNTIQLGNTSIISVKTSGQLTTGTITFPNTDGTSGQTLITNGNGTISWANTSAMQNDITDEMTATSSQTNFPLSQTPSANSKVKMYINGIRISNAAYSVTGNTLTYRAANNGYYSLTGTDRIQFDYSY